eukprot:gene18294-23976_t
MIRNFNRIIKSNEIKRSLSIFTPSEGKRIVSSDEEQQAGRRLEELQEANAGRDAFNRDPIIPDAKAGTKENPILVPSGLHSRVVGYEDPNCHQVLWFNLKEGPIHYIPTIGLYFKLKAV